MPNHCSNALMVTGESETIARFLAGLKTHTGKFEYDKDRTYYDLIDSYHPTPPELVGTQSPSRDTTEVRRRLVHVYGYDNWYDWNIAHWSTKWGDYDTVLETQTETSLGFNFASAWSPPIKAFDKIAADWPGLTFSLEYAEPGMGFRGTSVWKGGKQTVNQTSEYTYEDEDEEGIDYTYAIKTLLEANDDDIQIQKLRQIQASEADVLEKVYLVDWKQVKMIENAAIYLEWVLDSQDDNLSYERINLGLQLVQKMLTGIDRDTE